MSDEPSLRDELRKAAAKNRERPEWTKRRMPTIAPRPRRLAYADHPDYLPEWKP